MFDVNQSAGPEQASPYPLPTFDLENLSFVKPSTKSTTVITEVDGVRQADPEPTVEKTPFSVTLALSPRASKELVQALGISNTPSASIEVSVLETDSVLQAHIECPYRTTETRTRQVPSGTRQVAWKGSESYPYGPKATHDEWETIYTSESYEVPVTKAEVKDIELSGEALGVIYASIYNAAVDTASAKELLDYLDEKHPDDVASAKQWMESQIEAVLAQRQAEQLQLKDFSFTRPGQ